LCTHEHETMQAADQKREGAGLYIYSILINLEKLRCCVWCSTG
jgi:hypothetical protein